MRAQTDQHEADGGLDRRGDIVGHRMAEPDCDPGKYRQSERMAEPPGQAVLDDVADVGAARGDAGDSGDMIGLERVLHAQQKTQSQNSEHLSPARPTRCRRSAWNFPSARNRHKPNPQRSGPANESWAAITPV